MYNNVFRMCMYDLYFILKCGGGGFHYHMHVGQSYNLLCSFVVGYFVNVGVQKMYSLNVINYPVYF